MSLAGHPYDCPCVMCDPCQARWRQENRKILDALEYKEEEKKMKTTISTYTDDGRVFEYDIEVYRYPDWTDEIHASVLGSKGREHAAAIIAGGYRHNDGAEFEHYPPHRILKVKVTPAPSTKYPDRVRGT